LLLVKQAKPNFKTQETVNLKFGFFYALGEEAARSGRGGSMFKKLFGKQNSVKSVCSPVSGSVIPLGEVKDQTFSAGILGEGIAVRPTEGRIVSPADGIVETMFQTGHAVSMVTNDGIQLLIHVGIDTVELKGRFFKAFVGNGEHVRKGQQLITFDLTGIAEAGYDTVVPVIVCNSDEYAKVSGTGSGTVGELDPLLELESS